MLAVKCILQPENRNNTLIIKLSQIRWNINGVQNKARTLPKLLVNFEPKVKVKVKRLQNKMKKASHALHGEAFPSLWN